MRSAATKAYSGFPSAQLETYYHRIHLKMVEFLADFVIQCLNKDLCGCVKAVSDLAAEISQMPTGIHPGAENTVDAVSAEEAPIKADNSN